MGMKKPVEIMLDGLDWKPIPKQSEPSGDLPYATHEGVLEIMGKRMRCYRLNTGQAVFNAEDFDDFWGLAPGTANESDPAYGASPEAKG